MLQYQVGAKYRKCQQMMTALRLWIYRTPQMKLQRTDSQYNKRFVCECNQFVYQLSNLSFILGTKILVDMLIPS